MNILNQFKQIPVSIHKNRFVAAPEQLPISVIAAVVSLCIHSVDMAHAARKICLGGLHEKVVMVGHQAVRRDPEIPCAGRFFEKFNETPVVIGIMKNGLAHVQAGAGIVHDSDPQNEYEECQQKAKALLAAIDDAERGEGGRPSGSLGY